MTAEAATAFAERLKTDEALQGKLAAAPNPEERLAIAREEGFDISADDIGTVKENLGIHELSDEELEQIAGGGTATASISVAVSLSVAASSAALI